MTAIKLCVVEKRVYTQEVLAVVFQQLMDQNPLPTLMMRTVLQSLNIHPKLSGFVMNMLQRLIVKQVLRPCLSVLYCHCCWKNSRISLSSKIHDTINFFLMLCFSLSLSLSFFLSFFQIQGMEAKESMGRFQEMLWEHETAEFCRHSAVAPENFAGTTRKIAWN